MKKKRLIPVLLLRNGWLVQSRGFRRYQNLGNPTAAVARLSEWASDEVIYLDISKSDLYDMRRDDLGRGNPRSFLKIIEEVGRRAFMPMTVGGRIRTLRDIEIRLSLGADKTAINTQAHDDPEFIASAAREFGSQCVVVSMDVKLVDGRYEVFSRGGQTATGHSPEAWARLVEERGAGEILLNSIDRDGSRRGYDLDLLALVSDAVRIPVIGLGGVGEWGHLSEALTKTAVDAVAVANLLHHLDQSVYLAKKHLYEQGCNVRPPHLFDSVRP